MVAFERATSHSSPSVCSVCERTGSSQARQPPPPPPPTPPTPRCHALWIMRTEGFNNQKKEKKRRNSPEGGLLMCVCVCVYAPVCMCIWGLPAASSVFLSLFSPLRGRLGFHVASPPPLLYFFSFFYVGHCTAACLMFELGGGNALRRRCAFCFLEELRYDSKPWQSDAEEKNNNYFGYNGSSPNTGCSEWRWYRASAYCTSEERAEETVGGGGVKMWVGVCWCKRGGREKDLNPGVLRWMYNQMMWFKVKGSTVVPRVNCDVWSLGGGDQTRGKSRVNDELKRLFKKARSNLWMWRLPPFLCLPRWELLTFKRANDSTDQLTEQNWQIIWWWSLVAAPDDTHPAAVEGVSSSNRRGSLINW